MVQRDQQHVARPDQAGWAFADAKRLKNTCSPALARANHPSDAYHLRESAACAAPTGCRAAGRAGALWTLLLACALALPGGGLAAGAGRAEAGVHPGAVNFPLILGIDLFGRKKKKEEEEGPLLPELPDLEDAPPRTGFLDPEDGILKDSAAIGEELAHVGRYMEEGFPELAAEQYERAAQRYPIIADHALRLQAEALLESARPADAVRVANMVLRAVDVPAYSARRAARVLGDAHIKLRDNKAAGAAWRRAAEGERDSGRIAELLALRASAAEAAGDRASALELLLEIWSDYAATAQGDEAERLIWRLDSRALKRPDVLRRRCYAQFKMNQNEIALSACSAALEQTRSSAERTRLLHKSGDTLFRLRRYPEAEHAYRQALRVSDWSAYPEDDVPEGFDPERMVLYQVARTQARYGDIDAAVESFEALAGGGGEPAVNARYLAGTLLEESEPERANALYRSVDDGEYLRDALWRLGWNAYRAGDFAQATAHFDGLAAEGEPLERLRGRYWAARSREQGPGGRRRAGRQAFAAIAGEFPLSYYGMRAREQLGRGGRARNYQRVLENAANTMRVESASIPLTVLKRTRILISAGLHDDAVQEIWLALGGEDAQEQAQEQQKQAQEQKDREQIAPAYQDIFDRALLAEFFQGVGAWRQAQQVALNGGVNVQYLAQGPVTKERTAPALWAAAWPPAFNAEVNWAVERARAVFIDDKDSARRLAALQPALLFAVMREESGYRPEVISVAGARGLAQIMPATGEILAEQVGLRRFKPDDLFEPEKNLQLAAWYLAELLQRFDGRLSAAVAAYNAGPDAVEEWLVEAAPETADDEWVEAIPFAQTRGYVRRVLRSMEVYRLLYE